MTPAEEAVFWLATVRYLLYCDRIEALDDMGPLAKSSSISDAGCVWDLSRVPWRKQLTAVTRSGTAEREGRTRP